MDKKTSAPKIPPPPRGIKAIPWRLPIWIYRLRLGWILGHRMLLLTHLGRVSGKPRKAVLEVIRHEKDTNIHYVVSGFGKKSDWFKNIQKNPKVTIESGGEQFRATATQLPPDEAETVFWEYHRQHPKAIQNLSKLIGYDVGETDDDLKSFFHRIPVIKLQPDQPD